MKPHFLFVFLVSSFIVGGDHPKIPQIPQIPLFPGPTSFGTPVGTPPQMYTPTTSRKSSIHFEHTSTSLAALYGLARCSLQDANRSGQSDIVQVHLDQQEKALPAPSAAQKDEVGPEFPGTNWTIPAMPRTDAGEQYRAGCGMYFPK